MASGRPGVALQAKQRAMRVIDESLLASIRLERCCWCDSPGPSEAHHVFTRATGRIDLPWSIVPLCSLCHYAHHYSGPPSTADLLAKASERTGVNADDITAAIYAIRRAPKGDIARVRAILGAIRCPEHPEPLDAHDGEHDLSVKEAAAPTGSDSAVVADDEADGEWVRW